MKTIWVGAVALLLATSIAGKCVAQSGGFDFRKVTWGMTSAEVKTGETAVFYRTDKTTLIYVDDVAGSQCLISYHFDTKNHRLFLTTMTWSWGGNLATLSARVKEALRAKYGDSFGTLESTESQLWFDGRTLITYRLLPMPTRKIVVSYESIAAIEEAATEPHQSAAADERMRLQQASDDAIQF